MQNLPWTSLIKNYLNNFLVNHLNKLILYCLLFGAFFSCTPIKNQVYFENLKKDTTLKNVVTKDYDIKIQKSDILGISVASLSPDVAFYNASSASTSSANASATGTSAGYPVDKDGDINFVKIGLLHVEGKTRKELKDTLEKVLIPYLKDVIVNVVFADRHITVLGAVSTKVLPLADNMTLLDALASVGDIGEKGKIDNVLLIRDSSNNKQFERINLKNHSIFYSHGFYLQPNDIVYVEPQKIKQQVSTTQIISYITAGLSLILILVNTVFKL